MNPAILEMKNITKEFPGVKALNDVSFQVAKGEIHCLVGENGAGKSTLMKVLSGVYPHGEYSGDILFNGEVQRFSSISDWSSDVCSSDLAERQQLRSKEMAKAGEIRNLH